MVCFLYCGPRHSGFASVLLLWQICSMVGKGFGHSTWPPFVLGKSQEQSLLCQISTGLELKGGGPGGAEPPPTRPTQVFNVTSVKGYCQAMST